MKFLVAEDDDDLREIICYILENELNASVVPAHNGEDAINKLNSEKFDVVISDFNMPKKNGDDVYKATRQQEARLPFVLISTASHEKKRQHTEDEYYEALDKPFTNTELITTVEKVLKKTTPSPPEQEINARPQDFIAVPTFILYKIGKLDLPLYLQISTDKFVKILHAGSEIDANEKARLASKQVQNLWIEKIHYSFFINEYQRRILSKVFWKTLPPADAVLDLSGSHNVIKKAAKTFGWSPEVIELATQTIQQTIQYAMLNPDLKQAINLFKSGQQIRLSTHCILIAIACTAIVKKLQWEHNMAIEKLTFAALLHDIELDEEFFIRKQSLLNHLNLKELNGNRDIKVLIEHPLKAAEALSCWPLCPPDVDVIIRQHHEKPDGKGFPLGLQFQKIAPLSAVFIVAEDVIYSTVENVGSTPLEYLKSRKEYYSHGEFKKIFQAFLETLE